MNDDETKCDRCNAFSKQCSSFILNFKDNTIIIESRVGKYRDYRFAFIKNKFAFEPYTIRELMEKFPWIKSVICESCIEQLLYSKDIMTSICSARGNPFPIRCISCDILITCDYPCYTIYPKDELLKKEYETHIRPSRLGEVDFEPYCFYYITDFSNSLKFLQSKQPYKDICLPCIKKYQTKRLIIDRCTDDYVNYSIYRNEDFEEDLCYNSVLLPSIFPFEISINYIYYFKQYQLKKKLLEEIKKLNYKNES